MIEQAKEAIEGSLEEALKASKAATDSILNAQMEQVNLTLLGCHASPKASLLHTLYCK